MVCLLDRSDFELGRNFCATQEIPIGFLRRAPDDFDFAFEVRALFDHNLCRRQIPIHRTALFDLDFSSSVYVPLHIPVHHHLAGVDVGR